MDASTGHRCDRCGAAAKVADTKGTQVWRWCRHHGREYGPTLAASGFERRELAMPDLQDVGPGAVTGS